MSRKTTTILLIALAVLLAVFFIQKYASRPSTKMDTSSQMTISFDPQSVKAIRVFKQEYPDSGLSFALKDTGWIVVNEYNTAAKSEEVKKLLTDLSAVKGSLRGESEDLYNDFTITDKNALQIKLFGADSSLLAHVYVGKGGPDGKSCFLRLPGSPNVYLADNNFISRFAAWGAAPEKRLPTDRWMNLGLCKINRNDISSLQLHTPKIDYEFALSIEKPADTTMAPTKIWKQLSPQKGIVLDDSKIKGLQSSIGGLAAQGVVDPAYTGQFGLDKPKYSISVGDSLGNNILISFSEKIDTLEQRYVVVQGRNTVFRINKGVFERVFVMPFEKPKENNAPKPKAKAS